MAAPKEIIRLVENFARHRDEYRAAAYNEAQVRKEFIDPLFEALGWDMANRSGKAEAHKDGILLTVGKLIAKSRHQSII